MASSNGWVGKILKIDLSNGIINKEDTGYYEPEKFIGGRGLTASIFWENIDAKTHLMLRHNPWAPESLITIASGPATGTLAPTSGRVQLGGVAPQAYPKPAYTRSGMGGNFGPELKYAGYDGLYVVGQSDHPVYVVIDNDKVEIKDARRLWGIDTYETQRAIQDEHGSNMRIICIGPAGENRSRIATIIQDTGSAFGQGGFGGVMGSKNLKAIAVRGEGVINVADPEKLLKLAEYTQSLLNRSKQGKPSQYFPKPFFGKYYNFKEEDFLKTLGTATKRWDSCQSCPIGCRYLIDVPGFGYGHAQCVDFAVNLVKTAFSKKGWESTVKANKLGINLSQWFGLLDCLSAAQKAGHITEQETGLPFSKPDNSGEFLSILFDLIAQRRGIGNQAAEGMPRFSDYLAETYHDPSFKQMSEMFGHRGMQTHWFQHFPTNALIWASDSRDPFNDFHEYTLWYSRKCRYATREQKEAAAERAYGSKKALDYRSYEWVPQTVRRLVQRSCIKSSLILCDWAFPIVMNQYTDEHQGDTSLESQIYSAVTGLNTSEEEMYKIGERIFNLERALMVREGRRREQDHLAPKFAVPNTEMVWYGNYEDGPTEEKNVFVDPDYFNSQLLDSWYQLLGWTSDGIPTRARLKELGVEDIADKLKLQ